jgi:hypothetical protein
MSASSQSGASSEVGSARPGEGLSGLDKVKRMMVNGCVFCSSAAIEGSTFCREHLWIEVKDGNLQARELFGRHYTYRKSRDQISLFWQRNRNYNLIAGPGEKLLLLNPQALFVWRKFISMDHQEGVNCAVFRNEGPVLSSELIREADRIAWQRWPGERLYIYVDANKTRRKRDPGRCFLRAGWNYCGTTLKGLLILEIKPEPLLVGRSTPHEAAKPTEAK